MISRAFFLSSAGTTYQGDSRVLVALGQPEAVAASRAERFREHDEKLLRTQYQVQDDEAALIQTSREAREELEQLFAADRAQGALDDGAPGSR